MRGFFLRGLAAGDHVGRVGQHLLVDIAERDDFHRRDLDQAEEIALAVPAATDQADAFALIREIDGEGGEGGGRESAAPVRRNWRRFMVREALIVGREGGGDNGRIVESGDQPGHIWRAAGG